jgi:hypothetical protein
MARVQVSDETWSAFRVGLGSVPVSVGLGRLVEREVASRLRRSASDAEGVREAVQDARVVIGELSALIERLEVRRVGERAPAEVSEPSGLLFR